ncbi:unnamed protein product, partial [Leptidea sinapis]
WTEVWHLDKQANNILSVKQLCSKELRVSLVRLEDVNDHCDVKRLAVFNEQYDKMYTELTNPCNKNRTMLKKSVDLKKNKKNIPVKKPNSSNVNEPTHNQTIASKRTNKIPSESSTSIIGETTKQSVELKEHNTIYRDKKSQSDNITRTTPNEHDASKEHNACEMSESSNV